MKIQMEKLKEFTLISFVFSTKKKWKNDLFIWFSLWIIIYLMLFKFQFTFSPTLINYFQTILLFLLSFLLGLPSFFGVRLFFNSLPKKKIWKITILFYEHEYMMCMCMEYTCWSLVCSIFLIFNLCL